MKKNLADALKELEAQHQLNPLRQAVLKQELLANLNEAPKQVSKAAWFFSYKISYISAALIVVVILAGTGAYATEMSLPGDLLHPVKLVAEKIETKLAASEEKKAEIEVKHTSARINELRDLDLKAESETSLEHKTKIEERHRSAELETETRVERTLDNLEQVREKLSERGRTKAAESISISIERLKSKASESRIKLKRKQEEQKSEEIKNEDKLLEDKPIEINLEIRNFDKSDDSEDDKLEDFGR